MAADSQDLETPEDFGNTPEGRAKRWKEELDAARKGPYRSWLNKAKKAVKRYRDEDPSSGDQPRRRNAQFNVLWSNIATTAPSIYSRPPVPVVERRFLDKDIVARAASVILQRSLAYQIEESGLHETAKQCRLDLQLVAWCSAWVRYEPTYEKDETAPALQNEIEGEKPRDDEGVSEISQLRVRDECLKVDYTHWEDELVSPARFWPEKRWRAKRAKFSRRQLKKLSPEYGGKVPLSTDTSEKGAKDVVPFKELMGRAEVWQIWDFEERRTIWLCEAFDGPALKEVDDLMELKEFAPSAMPARATTTNDTIWPIPDYSIYFDQARELDSLTSRIAALTRAIKVVGVFDNSIPELERMLQEGYENKLIGTKNWAKLSQKGGIPGAVSLLPIKEFADALMALYQARTVVKQDLYEISGSSDIMRGATNPNETAKAQQLKGQFSGLRLEDRRAEFNRFLRDTLHIMANIICEWFHADTIWLMSDFEQWAKEQDIKQWALERFPPASPPMMGHNGGPPLDGMGAPGAMMPPSPGPFAPAPGMSSGPGSPPVLPPGGASSGPAGGPQPAPAASSPGMAPGAMAQPGMPQGASNPTAGAPPMASSPGTPPMPGMPMPQPAQPPAPPSPSVDPKTAMRALFDEALRLLRNDKLRSFRIDIETDSTISQDQQQDKQDATEFISAVTQFIASASEMAASMPQLMPVMGKMMLWGVRRFRVGRDLEGSLETLVAELEKQARNPAPKPPSPEEIKAKAVEQKAASDQEKAKLDLQADMQRLQMEMQAERQKLEFEREKLQLEREKLMMQLQAEQQKLAIKQEEGQISLSIKAREGQMQAQQQDRQAAMDEQQMAMQGQQMAQQAEYDERKLERTEEHDEHKLDMAKKADAQKVKAAAAKPAAGGNGK
jgi:hypothetical protein